MPEQPTQPAESAQAEQLSFIGFVISLATTAAVHFGDVVNPVSGEKGAPDLVAAKQMIAQGTGGLMANEAGSNNPIDFTHNSWFPNASVWWTNTSTGFPSPAAREFSSHIRWRLPRNPGVTFGSISESRKTNRMGPCSRPP